MIVLLAYAYIVILDFRYKEMLLVQVIASCLVNALWVLIISWERGLFVYIAISIVIWGGLVFINTLTKEKEWIGDADIDVFSLQVCLVSAYLVWIFRNYDGFIRAIMIFSVLQTFISALILGFILVFLSWIVIMIIKYIMTRKDFKTLYYENNKTPALLGFVPLAFVNANMIGGTYVF